jgi:peptide/nickel transport system substrate-binding protein
LKMTAEFDRRRFLQIGGGLTMAGVLAACTSSSSPKSSKSPSAAPSASGGSSASASSSAASSASAVTTPGGTTGSSLSVLVTDVATSLDRDSSQATGGPGLSSISMNVMEPLIGFKNLPNGANFTQDLAGLPGSLQPRLATSFSQTGPTTWRFILRQGVVNSLGSKFTSADVLYTFNRAYSISGQTTAALYVATTGGLLPATKVAKTITTEIVAVDDYTVDFNLFAVTGLFPTMLAVWNQYIFDSTTMKAHATTADPWSHDWMNAGNAAGFGPYQLKQLTPGASATLVADPNYWRGQPKYTTINISASSNGSAQLAAIESGSAQVAEGLTAESLKTLQKSPTVSVAGGYTNKLLELFMNYNYAPWNSPGNVALRQAVAYALPYDEIINGVYPDVARRSYSHVPSTFDGYTAINTYSTDLDKAKALMVTAGFPGGKGLSASMEGLQLYWSNDQTDLQTVATYVKSALASIGIPITLNPITPTVFATKKGGKSMPMVLDPGDNPLIPDALYLIRTFYVTPSAGGLVDEGNYSNSEVDTMAVTAFAQTGAPRTTAAAAIQKILMDQLPAIPVAELQATVALKKGIVGYVPLDQTNVTEYQWLT